jgi:hypothetical protein
MNLKVLTIAAILAASSGNAGERVENEEYRLPDFDNPAVFVICQNSDALEALLDNLSEFIRLYNEIGFVPPNCSVFIPPIPIGEHHLEYLWVADDNRLFGVIRLPAGEQTFWTYIDGQIMVKGKEGTF